MKLFVINIILLFLSVFAVAQTRNLDFYVEQAINNSPLINKSNNTKKLIQLDMQRVKSILTKPIVNLEGGLLFSPIISHDNNTNKIQWVSEGANSYTGYDLAYTDGGQYKAYVSVKQPLFMGKTYNSYSHKADVQTKIATNEIILTKHEITQLVSRQYIICLLAKQQTEISKVLLDKLNTQILIMQKLVKNAIYRQTDLMLMQIETQNFEIDYQKKLAEYYNHLSDLNLLSGIPDTTNVELKNLDLKISSDTLSSSYFINKFTLDSINIIANKNIFNQKYRPQINLFADAGMNAIYLPSFNRFGLAAGINFTWNIFDGNQKKNQYNKSLTEIQTIEFEKQNFINQNNINKSKYLAQIAATESQIKITENQLVEYEKLMSLYQLELSQSQISVMDYKNLIRDIYAKKQENARLKMQKQMLINSYNYWNF